MGSGLVPTSSSLGSDLNCQWNGTKGREGGGAQSLNYSFSVFALFKNLQLRTGHGCVWLCLLYSLQFLGVGVYWYPHFRDKETEAQGG